MNTSAKRWLLGSGATLLAALVVVWWFGWFGGDSVLANLERQRDALLAGDPTPEQRQAFREQIGTLTDAQRREFFQRSRPQFQQRIHDRMEALFALPPEQLEREVQKRVDAVLVARTEREAAPPGGPPGGRPPRTDAERDTRRKQRLDFIDPQTRARFTQMRGLLNAELESRGEEPLSGRDMRALIRGGR